MNTVDELLERLEASERAATGPPAETGERVWTGIEDRLANGPAPPEIDDAPLLEHVPQELVAANAGASSSVVLKVVGVLAIVGVIGGGVALSSKRNRTREPVRAANEIASVEAVSPEAPAPESPLPEPAPSELAPPEPELVEPSEPPTPLDPPPEEPSSKPKTPPKATPKEPGQPKSLADEVALMQSLSTALKQEDSSKVLELVAEHERDFPKGQFIEERRAAKARALCKSGKLEAGKREAEQFASRWPRSIHLPFVNEDCGLE